MLCSRFVLLTIAVMFYICLCFVLTIAVMLANDCSHVIQNTRRTKEEQVISLSLSLVTALTSKPFGLWQS